MSGNPFMDKNTKRSTEAMVQAYLESRLRLSIQGTNDLCRILGKEPQWVTKRARKAKKEGGIVISEQARLLCASEAIVRVFGVEASDMQDPAMGEKFVPILEACSVAIEIAGGMTTKQNFND